MFLVLLLVYAADWAVWRIRSERGNGSEMVTVSRVSVASLKSNKEEYYFDGTDVLPCARSMFPPLTSGGFDTPCWWLQRHTQQVMRY